MDIREKAQSLGIQPTYVDVWEKEHDVPESTLETLVAALGEPEEQTRRVVVIDAERRQRFSLGAISQWEITDEQGATVHSGKGDVDLPPLAMGYYTLRAGKHSIRLIAAPPRCWMPPALDPDQPQRQRVWGLAVQLYSLRSQRNWGIGDFGDLAALVEGGARRGMAVVGLNPLHALFPSDPAHYSPYAPSSRIFLNSLYIDVAQVPGFTHTSEALDALRQTDLVNYPGVWRAKSKALETLFERFRGDTEFDRFCREQGEALYRQALFDALMEHFTKAQGEIAHWRDWPNEYRNPDMPQVQAFAAAHADQIRYYCWLQWLADRQLAAAQTAARKQGMAIGLYRDLAVGASPLGAEIWCHHTHFLYGASIGAPPDRYNPMGQDWSLPPFNPVVLQKEGFEPFIQLLRANMRHAGGLRIDHAFGLDRLFLIPEGAKPHDGAYLHYPFKEMLAVLKLESHRNQCMVIGEGLGTPPPDYQEKAEAAGLASCHVFYFEKDEQGYFPPSHYPARALASLSTHDLPTMAGWLKEADIDERNKFHLYPDAKRETEDREGRKEDRKTLEAALARENLSVVDPSDAVVRYLARSPAAIVMVQAEDVLGVVPQVNLPATTTQRPNWRMKLPETIESIMADARFVTLADDMRKERARPLADIPRATYRLQFHKGFTFRDAAKTIPYLARLGVSHVYASPYMQACPGSTHGYDVVDPNAFNPELGGEEGYRAFRSALAEHGLGQVLDIVPNHMGIACENPWWESVLREGRDSPYADYFDIDWEAGDGKVILPVLEAPLAEMLAEGKITQQDNVICYGERQFPLCNNGADAPLDELLAHQHYRLAPWREASANYRRFFAINDLVGIRVEKMEVFDAVHRRVLELVQKGDLQGLRIDHIDGLADPAGYVRNLKGHTGGGIYLIAEKILGAEEQLSSSWGIHGTTGYDALNQIGGLFIHPEGGDAMTRIWQEFAGITDFYVGILYESKKKVLDSLFPGDVARLARLLKPLLAGHEEAILRQALSDIVARFPVYRTYVTPRENSMPDREYILQAVREAKTHSRLPATLYDSIGSLLMLEAAAPGDAQLAFVRKFQQLTGAIMAKGMEDTAFYRYNLLLSLNEVGGAPERFGITPETFHHLQWERARQLPHAMLATATHDTKRGEDARLRLAVLSEMPEAWRRWVTGWSELNGASGISRNDEYFLYQTLLASWPMELLDTLPETALEQFTGRVCGTMTKAVCEAKEHSDWIHRNHAYEEALLNFVRRIMDKNHPFLKQFIPAVRMLAQYGVVNSLAQAALKLTLPGVPDIYQGAEYWDLSMVDPDNRRPVDYALRARSIEQEEELSVLLLHWQDGRVKQRMIQKLLAHRKAHRELYERGDYQPLHAQGQFAGHVFVFARSRGSAQIITLIPIFPVSLAKKSQWPLGDAWDDTCVALQHSCRNILTGEEWPNGEMVVAKLLGCFTVAVLERV